MAIGTAIRQRRDEPATTPDRLILAVFEEDEATVSGIVLPDTARERPQRGRVLAVGPGAARARERLDRLEQMLRK